MSFRDVLERSGKSIYRFAIDAKMPEMSVRKYLKGVARVENMPIKTLLSISRSEAIGIEDLIELLLKEEVTDMSEEVKSKETENEEELKEENLNENL